MVDDKEYGEGDDSIKWKDDGEQRGGGSRVPFTCAVILDKVEATVWNKRKKNSGKTEGYDMG